MMLNTETIKMKEENKLFYTDRSETKELGCIGHLRGDFGKDGREFHTTWFPHENDERNNDFFKDVFDMLINVCRDSGNPLFDRARMREYCRAHPEYRLDTGYSPTWGFRIPTQDFMFYLRCCPDLVGDYNFYVFAYDKPMLMEKLAFDRRLPHGCYGILKDTNVITRLNIATSGYAPFGKQAYEGQLDMLNSEIGVTKAQAEAMLGGTMFGWDTPSADPGNYDEYGRMLKDKYVIWSNLGLDDIDRAYSFNDELLHKIREKLDVRIDEGLLSIEYNDTMDVYYETVPENRLSECLYPPSDTDMYEWYVDSDNEFASNKKYYSCTHTVIYRKWNKNSTAEERLDLLEKLEEGTATKADIDAVTEKLGEEVMKAICLEQKAPEQTKPPRSGGER